MFYCPVCRTVLDRTKSAKGLVWTCAGCGGHASTITILRKNVAGPFVSNLWGTIIEGEGLRPRPDRPCPSCARSMSEITSETITGPVEIDVCRGCRFFWFDPGEIERFPAPPPAVVEPELHPRAREALALATIEAIRLRHEPAAFENAPPDEWWKILATIVGLPAETEEVGLSRKPFLTWGIGLLIVIVGLLTIPSLDVWVRDYGLLPADPLRSGGLTLLTSFFLHGGWLHLLGNLYFLIVFGDNVEDFLGHSRYLLLLVLAALVGDAAHIASDPESIRHAIGASGGISGIIAFYALAFPRNQIGICLPFF
ncbi:MAG: rhomboid family intramembrane serine protease [Verrucomicrobiaceae bacterium]|nr:rhomboid family intramembrane serine protease [Verrucomicrobiaceae bacterium]